MPRLPPVLRPRATWRYIFFSSVAAYVAYCFAFRMPLFSSNLPAYTGPYPVGTIDLETPCKQRLISDITFKTTGEPAFKLDTVLFTLYYPSEQSTASSKPHHYWLAPPIALTAEGYARFAHINNFFTNHVFTFFLWLLAGGNTIPADVDVPLRNLHEPIAAHRAQKSDAENTYPLLVFSHGMASSRTSYTQYCGELASRGYVVAAIEHRDGSGPGTVIMKDGEPNKNWLHMALHQLQSDSGLDTAGLKKAQLDFRQAEVEETVRVLREINLGRGAEIFAANSREEGQYLKTWQDRLDVDQFTIGGHSYGATLALQALKGGPSKALPFKGAIILDPGKQSGPLNDDVRVPTLVVHSNSWSSSHSVFFGRPHFDVVKDLVDGIVKRGKDAWFMTSLGTSHPSVTDAPLIEPMLLSWTTGSSIEVREGIHQYVKVSEEFLQYQMTGTKAGLLAQSVSHPKYGDSESASSPKSTILEEYRKFWQVHVAPA